MFKRLICFLLTMVLLFSTIPPTAFAQEMETTIPTESPTDPGSTATEEPDIFQTEDVLQGGDAAEDMSTVDESVNSEADTVFQEINTSDDMELEAEESVAELTAEETNPLDDVPLSIEVDGDQTCSPLLYASRASDSETVTETSKKYYGSASSSYTKAVTLELPVDCTVDFTCATTNGQSETILYEADGPKVTPYYSDRGSVPGEDVYQYCVFSGYKLQPGKYYFYVRASKAAGSTNYWVQITYTYTAHTHNYSKTKVVPPSCSSQGYTQHTCSCGDSYKDNYVARLPHTEARSDEIPATCITTGLKAGIYCSVCNATISGRETIPLTDHSYVNDVCSYCGYRAGKCGKKLTYELDLKGNLTITGTGDMYDYEQGGAPWYDARDSVKTVTLPEGITGIGDYAFEGLPVSKITIPDTVTSIGDGAFSGCVNITKVDLPDAITVIGNSTFAGCTKLTDLEIPAGVTKIGNKAFAKCIGLTKLLIPAAVTSIGNEAFSGCGGLTYLCIVGKAPSFGSDVFKNVTATIHYNSCINDWDSITENYGGKITWDKSTHIYSLTGSVEPTCTKEGSNNYCCSCGFEKVEIVQETHKTENLCHICKKAGVCGDDAYWQYVANSGAGYTILYISGTGAMYDYSLSNLAPWYRYGSTIESIQVLQGITEIGEYAFYDCDKVWGDKLKLPDSLIKIASYSFYGCSLVDYVSLPHSISYIGSNAFYNCRSNFRIKYSGTIREWIGITKTQYPTRCSDGEIKHYGICGESAKWYLIDTNLVIFGTGTIYSYDYTNRPWYSVKSSLKSIVVENGITKISGNLFYDCPNLTDVSLPNSIIKIGGSVFGECTSLKKIVLPDSLGNVGRFMFSGCTSLIDVQLPANLKKIGKGAFENCSKLTSLSIPYSVDTVEYDALQHTSSSLVITYPGTMEEWVNLADSRFPRTIHCSNGSLLKWSRITDTTKWMLDDKGILTIITPGKMADYSSAPNWSSNQSSINGVVLVDGISHIGSYAFANLSKITDVSVPNTVSSIGNHAFTGCKGLHRITFQGSAPTFELDTFNSIIATAYYPAGDPSWTEDVMKDYGGTITWLSSDFCDHTIVTDSEITPNCIRSGKTEGYHCSTCGIIIKEQEVLAPLGHSVIISEGILPTCTESGLSEGIYCSVCNMVLAFQHPVSPLGHNEVVVAGYPATCIKDGLTEGKKCSACDIVILAQQTIKAIGHNEIILSAKEATCTKSGLTEGKKCSVCDTVTVKQKTVKAKGHKEETVPGKEATCTESGLSEGKKCTVCGTITVAQKTIKPKGHTEKKIEGKTATCTESGSTDGKTCSVCGTVTLEQETVPALGHSEEILLAKEATCTKSGLTEGKKCTTCGTITVKQKTVKAKGHKEEVVAGKAATCTEDGLTDGKKCTVCKKVTVKQTTIPKGHNIVDSTCTLCGLGSGTCGEKLTWTFDPKTGVLTISGTGKMDDAYSWPWKAYSLDGTLHTVIIEEGVTAIGKLAFYTCESITAVHLPKSLLTIENEAFQRCSGLTSITIPENVESIGFAAFGKCSSLRTVNFEGDAPEIHKTAFRDVTARVNYDTSKSGWKKSVMTDYGGKLTWVPDGRIPSVPMYRMYDPNSGEHFYSGAEAERDFLVENGWHYEGVGFNFPVEGAPVHRLYDPVYGEHLYTMDEKEMNKLLARGWNYEGVAFNSAGKDEVPQYRLHNPNAKRGGYHFTGSIEERDLLISFGWINQGIGWYSCLE